MTNDTVHVKGLADLARFLDELPAKVQRNVMRGALRAGAAVILPAARANIRPDTGALADSLKVGTRARGGTVTATVGSRYYTARWVEYGTRQHWITVRSDAAPKRSTRRGLRNIAVGTLNEMAYRGSLVIGQHFVGFSVVHPGAQARPFLRPALDTQAGVAVVAIGNYIKDRLATKHGLDTAGIIVEGDEP